MKRRPGSENWMQVFPVQAAFASLLLGSALLVQDPPAPVFPRTITVKVVDAKGASVSGALLELWPDERAAGFLRGGPMESDVAIPPSPPERTLGTNEAGNVAVRLSSASEVFAARAGSVGTSGLWYASGLAGDEPTLELQPFKEITGTVRLADGQPAPGASVRFGFRLHEPLGERTRMGYGQQRPPADVTADEQGRFRISVEGGFTGDAWAMVGAARTEDVRLYGTTWGKDTIELRLPGEFHVRGACVGPDGAPITGGTVVALRRLTDNLMAMTHADGRFDVALVHAGRYAIDLDLPPGTGFVLPDPMTVEVTSEHPVADVLLRPVTSVSIQGRVRGTGGAAVSVHAEDTEGGGLPRQLRNDRYRSVHLEGGAKEFEITGFVPGRRYDITAGFTLGDASSGSRWVGRWVRDIEAGASGVEIDFDDAVIAGGEAFVHCIDASSGAPLTGATVGAGRWEPPSFAAFPRVIVTKDRPVFAADAAGMVRCTGLTFALLHGLIASAPGYESVPLGPLEMRTALAQLRASLRPLESFRVRVLGEGSDGVPEARVLVLRPNAPLEPGGYDLKVLSCDAAGEVRFDGVHGEPMWIQARSETGTSPLLPFTPAADETPVVITLAAPGAPVGCRLEVRAVDLEDRPIAGAELRAGLTGFGDGSVKPTELRATTNADGLAVFEDLEAGIWWLKCFDLDRGIGFGMAAVPGGTAKCTLRAK
jgi:hypothetical protein